MSEVHIEIFRNLTDQHVTATHIPTGLRAEAGTRAEALRILRRLVDQGLPPTT